MLSNVRYCFWFRGSENNIYYSMVYIQTIYLFIYLRSDRKLYYKGKHRRDKRKTFSIDMLQVVGRIRFPLRVPPLVKCIIVIIYVYFKQILHSRRFSIFLKSASLFISISNKMCYFKLFMVSNDC